MVCKPHTPTQGILLSPLSFLLCYAGSNLDGKIVRVGVANPLASSGKQEANIYVAGKW